MARQVRAEVTRESVVRGAAEIFMNLGYANASLNEIIQESGVTKGALYFHFASKEELARGVVDAGFARLAEAAVATINDRTPALETLIELSVLTVDLSRNDPVVRAMFRLAVEIGDYRGTGDRLFDTWLATMRDLAKRALAEGDLNEDVDPDMVGLFLLQVLTGVRMVAAALDCRDALVEYLENAWGLMLPALVPPAKAEYFKQFASRRLRV
ncbi:MULTISPECIES: ScbR family autoregulator-binding transcription factor [Rhodococcus]|uniref:Transcriptional regulator n=3 Tax=Rhodococcus TaxID=1827 RepID=M2ZM08_9NOCA|nr:MULTISPECIES: ScbR family autoregulator-binding transcription factor [Rhodococcus]EME61918.1 transcriptional regulator [Rhodococcus ruber BKS 20-38]KOS57044.1 TetR family transcriptional regulator [Rhodococcus rhodochrous KG-21]MDM7486867.1 ScbR family autoregulator-binding transcription factor [Rhodococcus indonesiensis]MDO1477460.1 TetR/AcrR family transcriptional regulator [Rhodococcus ruber]